MPTLRLVTVATAENPNIHDLYLNESGQLEWDGLDPTDSESVARDVAQSIRCAFLQRYGEWYLDQREGVRGLIGKGITITRLKTVTREILGAVPGIRSVVSVDVPSYNTETREATITWNAVTETDQIVTSDQLDIPFILGVPENDR